MAFGDVLKTLREQAGLSQAELAEKVGLSRVSITRLENGKREPGWGTVQALARALEVSCDVFRDDRDNGADDETDMVPALVGYMVGCLRHEDREALAIEKLELLSRRHMLVTFRTGLVLRVTVRVEKVQPEPGAGSLPIL